MSTPHRRFAIRWFVALLGFLTVASGCGPNPNSPSSITGTWVGTLVSSTSGTGFTQLTLSQSGSSITGTFANTFPGATTSSTGPLTGTLNGSAFTAALAFIGASGTCTRTYTGTWSGTALSGTYVASGVCGNLDSGTFSLTLE
jgi:hypothetical protein